MIERSDFTATAILATFESDSDHQLSQDELSPTDEPPGSLLALLIRAQILQIVGIVHLEAVGCVVRRECRN